MRVSMIAFAALFSLACSDDPIGDEPISVELSYDDGSNWGPETATGNAEINPATGEVLIDVEGLPVLVDEVYEGWLAGGDETATSTGRFNVAEDGTGSSAITLGNISDATFARVVLTVEPEPDPSPGPDSRHSIGGNF